MSSGPPLRDLRAHPHFPALRTYKRRTADRRHVEGRGAHAVGIGRKTRAGRVENRLALIYYVEEKSPPDDLDPEVRIPKRIGWHDRSRNKFLHLATDVVVRAPARYQAIDPQARARPAPGGVSVGVGADEDATAGTLGGWVRDTTDGEVVMLSNQHIFLDRSGAKVLQQAFGDFGRPPAAIAGRVKRSVKIGRTNRCDCAIASPKLESLADCRVLGIGPGVYATEGASFEMYVEKYGQASQLTKGRIEDADWSGSVEGDWFEDCLLIAPKDKVWSCGGDSGSLVFARHATRKKGPRAVVGLHFAGFGENGGIACRIEHVFKELKLEVLTEETTET